MRSFQFHVIFTRPVLTFHVGPNGSREPTRDFMTVTEPMSVVTSTEEKARELTMAYAVKHYGPDVSIKFQGSHSVIMEGTNV